ncbi:Prefoldin subunit 6 [Coemansia sp. RSA 2706]|nr:Prefoldin subunit 6 [Coemansia sp. RSA 2706]KAJ2305623.1 Prefoldin subunit 6 [Coemansia sp. RSA 2705]KAJ2313551.1 Prefoldin subunit 6 [Coemansia sp. RSA 2704]KAJ2323283.1 Prefoldin subunit 6 [Coemansia sp. RSA 2702]KAJ2375241.1 Prefoldin subunit 6 [Coemansia sp. RSA 2611]KAJ2718135.1 Prefoldin subunit 6 [Coemansia sp. Cherry 401B]
MSDKAQAEQRKALEKQTMALQELRKEQTTLVESRQKLESQLQENELVDKEFKQLKDNARIYKMIGPVLVPQEKSEASANVEKRLEYIRGEVKRVEQRLEQLAKEQQTASMNAYKLQMEMQGVSKA